MFCNTFYCPYVKYTLKDIEAFCSLLSSADKNKNNSPDVSTDKRKLCVDYSELQSNGKPA